MIEIDLEKVVEEIGKVDEGKGEVDAEKGEETLKDASVEVVEKEKGEEKDDHSLMTMARDIVADKGKHIVTDLDDFTQGPIIMS